MADGNAIPQGAGFTMGDASGPPIFRTLDVAELLRTTFQPREMVLGPWLPGKGLAMIYGLRGAGKTHLSLGIAYAVATGGAFLRWQAPRPRRVLIIDGEMPAVVLQERMANIVAMANLEPPSPDGLRFLPMDLHDGGGLDLSNDRCHARLEAVIDGADLLIVDNISTLASGGGRENEAESWTPIQQWALHQRRSGRSVLFIHHAGKGGQQRGTSRREEVLDTVIALRRPTDYQPDQGARFELHYEKARGLHGDDANPFEASLGDGGIWTTRDLADVDMARVLTLSAEGESVRDIATALGMSKSRVQRLLDKGRALSAMPTSHD